MTERRTALKVLAGAGAVGTAGVAAAPVARFVAAPGMDTGSTGAAWHPVARFDALEAGRPLKATVTGTEVDAWTVAPDRRLGAVWLVRAADGSVKAWSATCPHLGCSIETHPRGFACPCHNTYFTPSGERDGGPSPRPMDALECRVADGRVEVRFQKFRLGTPDKVVIG